MTIRRVGEGQPETIFEVLLSNCYVVITVVAVCFVSELNGAVSACVVIVLVIMKVLLNSFLTQ